MEQKYVCLIPRNLEKEDTISVGRLEFTWRQVAYIALGGLGTYLSFTSGMPFTFKILSSVISFGIALLFGFLKINDTTLDEVAVNALIYAQRKNYYKKIEKQENTIQINFRARIEA